MKKRIGIIGGGQLARMMAQAAKKMGLTLIILDPTVNSPAAQVADSQIVGEYTDKEALHKLAGASDFITIEVEIPDEDILQEVLTNFRTLGKSVNPHLKIWQSFKINSSRKNFRGFIRYPQLPLSMS
jgi:Phosphoribosylaminoimidazole carboxylase (NCAIR synthetase)